MARTRSPSYPGIDLKEAMDKAKVIYQQEGTSAALVDTIAGHWGYKPGTGAVNIAMSALRKFNLVEYEGSGSSRKAKLTETGLRIIRDDREESPERDQAIRRLSLKPKIHGDLWEKVRAGASDETLISYLKLDKGYSDKAAPELVKQFKRTAEYANLWGSDTEDDGDPDMPFGDSESEFGFGDPRTALNQGAEGEPTSSPRVFRVPLTARSEAVLQVPPGMNEAQWDQMMAVLQAMKAGILSPDDDGLT